nr:hypothetical protein [uncultured Pseudodesulfovibrio sp.]
MVKDRRTFRTQQDAIGFLVDEGYASNKSNFSRHTREGKIGRNADGVFGADELLAYAAGYVKRMESGKTLSREEKERADAKAEAELLFAQEKAQRERIKRQKEEGGHCAVEDHLQDLAARMAFFSLQLDGFSVKQAEAAVDVVLGKRLDRAAQLIDLVGGDKSKVHEISAFVERLIPELAEIYMQEKQEWLAAFARERVFVIDLDAIEEDPRAEV